LRQEHFSVSLLLIPAYTLTACKGDTAYNNRQFLIFVKKDDKFKGSLSMARIWFR
jgi:hypothetical protein